MEKLKHVLAQEDTVLFVGSGISLWSGLPTWSGMIEELALFVEQSGANAELIRAEAGRGDLLQAASYGFDKLTKPQIGEFIRKACRYGEAKPHEIHRKVVSLGPRYFITTNYDDLIEQSLRKWQPDRFYPPAVSNRQLTEMGGIVAARASNFVFKPHGDAADVESIILTREQYRTLLPQGEHHAALESVKMLLASRPVVYLGFGLRDPDFIYVKDLLANTYQGGARDHYAIMADVSEPEVDFWRKNYGIHLVSYVTTARANHSKDHSALLDLLDTLREQPPVAASNPALDPKSPHVVLALARYAAGLSRMPKLDPEFPIRVHSETRYENGLWTEFDEFDNCPVEEFLDFGPEGALLIGLPGAGKSYSLRRATARLAERLHQACLADTFDDSKVVVPIFADLKLYRGDLHQLVSETLPASLLLHELIRTFKVKIYLDSFNEMPREFWESGSYEANFLKFTEEYDHVSLIIGSRTTDGLAKMELPTYLLDEIEKEAVSDELTRRGIAFTGRFSQEMHQLLQRPFYFQYIASGAITLPAEAHPRDFYKGLFEKASDAFVARFGQRFDLEGILSVVAYEALNRGEEAFPLTELLGVLKEALGTLDVSQKDIANWLVSISIVIPYTGGRIAFVHQSVTEYLAASELARRYLADPKILREKLALTRWDQALFLTVSLLPPSEAKNFLHSVIQADFVLALNAAKYLDVGRDEVISELLAEIPKQCSANFDWRVISVLQSTLPLNATHEPYLREMALTGDVLGGVALTRLASLCGEQAKEQFLPLLLERRNDFGFCEVGVGPALFPFVLEEDARTLAVWADQIEAELAKDTDDDEFRGFIAGAAYLLTKLDIAVIRREFLPVSGKVISKVRGKIVCSVLERLEDHHASAALPLAAELLLQDFGEVTTAIFLIGEFSNKKPDLSWECFTATHIAILEEMLVELDLRNEAMGALKCICNARPDLKKLVTQTASKKRGIEKAVLLYTADATDMNPVYEALEELLSMSEDQRKAEPLGLLRNIEFDWAAKDQLFFDLLKLRDADLASTLFGAGIPHNIPCLSALDARQLEWWLEWMLDLLCAEKFPQLLNKLCALFARNINDETLGQLLSNFNETNSKFRRLLISAFIPHLPHITTDDFSEDAISFLLADLSREESLSTFQGHVLGWTATERFIAERLLPLLPEAQPPLAGNLRDVLRQAGRRHGRRYIMES